MSDVSVALSRYAWVTSHFGQAGGLSFIGRQVPGRRDFGVLRNVNPAKHLRLKEVPFVPDTQPSKRVLTPNPNGYFTNIEVAQFLRGAVEGLSDPVIMLWDCATMHKGPPIRELVDEAPGRLDIEPVPPDSPELIPVEFLWTWLKYDERCNFAPRDASHLNEAIGHERDAAADNQELLRSFFHLSALHLPRTLLF